MSCDVTICVCCPHAKKTIQILLDDLLSSQRKLYDPEKQVSYASAVITAYYQPSGTGFGKRSGG